MQTKKNEKKRGSALIFATIVLFATLMVVITLSSITILETKMSQKTKGSTGAFFKADSGIEWAMNLITKGSGKISDVFGSQWKPALKRAECPSGYDCQVFLLDSKGDVIENGNIDIGEIKAIRAVGDKDADTSRAIEAAVASGDELKGCVKKTGSNADDPLNLVMSCDAGDIMIHGACWSVPGGWLENFASPKSMECYRENKTNRGGEVLEAQIICCDDF